MLITIIWDSYLINNSDIHATNSGDPRNIEKYKVNLEKFSLKYKPKNETNPIGTLKVRVHRFVKN